MSIAHVALPLPLPRTFAYRIPEPLAPRVKPGIQVQVPFRGRTQRGFVVELGSAAPGLELRDVAAVLDDAPLSPHLLSLARWVADYYLAPLGEVLAAALPGGLEGFAKSRGRRGAIEDATVRLALGENLKLTRGQREAQSAIAAAQARGGFAPFLLHGITASGKTEVYLRAATAARDSGRQTLVLVPEVALGSQLVAEFRRRFGGRVGVLHSYLKVSERRRNWELASRGALDVVVGARSAVFAPLPNPGLIVVDEEHEAAYKQSDRLRYHGRDTAVRRAQMLGIPVLLGSATPSLESLANAARGKYTRIDLPERIDRRALPGVRIVDLRREGSGPGLVSPALREAIARRLERGEQTMLFLNRRGHSHHTQCRGCGWVPECPECDIALTLHVSPRTWRCHYCGHSRAATAQCPNCGAALLHYAGAGTQRAERELNASFPAARILRLDLDVARRGEDLGKVIGAFRRGEADILVGTQMIAKGFDFPRVTLVGVLDADVGLHLPDFRAAERTYQLLVQVSGRSGRGETAGEVLIQTCTPDHPAIAAAVAPDARGFLEHELAQRRAVGYPPFARLAALLFTGREEAHVEAAAAACAAALRDEPGTVELTLLDEEPEVRDAAADAAPPGDLRVLGPAPHTFTRLRGQYRWHVLLKARKAEVLRAAAAAALERFESGPHRTHVKMAVDVDPIDVL